MASQLSDERTPFRAVQPDLVAQDVGDAKRASTPRKAEGAEAHLRCDDDIENAFAEIPLGGDGVVDEPEIRQSESPKRALVHSVARPATGRRQRAARSGMRSSVRHFLRTSMAMDANPAIRTSMASGGELFTREVFDVHSEIDKLLGGLKTELDNWRTEFESLQIYWFTHVMCVPDHPGGDLPPTDRVHLRSLYEFQALLERHIDETEYDIQDLEKRLKASEEDRCELQCLLEEGSLEVHYLETKQADSQREHGKRTNALQTRIKQAEREVMQCKKDMASRDQELEEMRKQVVEASEQVHAMESEASKAKAELKSANSKIQVYEDQIASVRKEFSGVAEANNEVQLQCKMLQASLDSKNDECKRITAELHCKSEEMRLLSKSIAQYEQRITDLQTEATDSFQMCLEKKERLQDDEKRIGLLEDSQKRLQAQVTSLSQKLKERESEVVGLRKELDVVTVAKEDLEKEVDSLGRAVDEKETDSIKHSKELKKIVSYLDQAKRELKEATVNEISLAEQIDALRAQCEDQRTEIRALAEEKTAMQDLFDQKSSQAAETKHALEERMRGYQEESERSKGEIEERLEAHYKQVISELEAHYGTLSSEKEKAFEGELARTKELLQENKNRAAEERNAMEISWKVSGNLTPTPSHTLSLLTDTHLILDLFVGLFIPPPLSAEKMRRESPASEE